MLELESGSNDPMAYMLTLLLIQIIRTPAGDINLWYSAGLFVIQMGVGALAGYVLGRIAVWMMNRLNVDNQSLYPILLLACVFFYIFHHRNHKRERISGRLHCRLSCR